MTVWTELETDFRTWVNLEGIAIDIQNKKETFTAGSYDEASWADSGTKQSGSAFFMTISQRTGGDELRLIEQGQLEYSDKKAYIPSGLEVHERADVVVDSGSYDLLGIKHIPNEANLVYRKIFLRSQI